MIRITVKPIDGYPVEGLEIDWPNHSQNALEILIDAFEARDIEFTAEQQNIGTFIRSIGYHRSTDDWHWSIAVQDAEGMVKLPAVGIDEIDLRDMSAIFFIATPTICSNNTQYGDDRTC